MDAPDSNQLCIECGLCCNGVIFADVQLEPEDNAQRLRSLGLPLALKRNLQTGVHKFPQPCAAFDGCHCRIYQERPQYCREFECRLLKKVKAGEVEQAAASRIIRTARRQVESIQRLFRELGDENTNLPLSVRFRRIQRRLEQSGCDDETANQFGQLTLAVHNLNQILSNAFYPGLIPSEPV